VCNNGITHAVLPATQTRTIPAFTPHPQDVTAVCKAGTHFAYPRKDGQAELT